MMYTCPRGIIPNSTSFTTFIKLFWNFLNLLIPIVFPLIFRFYIVCIFLQISFHFVISCFKDCPYYTKVCFFKRIFFLFFCFFFPNCLNPHLLVKPLYHFISQYLPHFSFNSPIPQFPPLFPHPNLAYPGLWSRW